MTFMLPQVDLLISLKEGVITTLVIEEPLVYRSIIMDLYDQSRGNAGQIVLSDKDKMLNIAKRIDLILNPLLINCNDKKILSKLYQDMGEIMRENFFDKMVGINATIVELLDEVTASLPYAIDHDLELDVAGLIKMYKVEMGYDDEDLVVRIIDYMKLMSQICQIDTFVFVGLKNYVNPEELDEIYKACIYGKINLFLIESSQHTANEREKCYIIDKDLCIIDLD